MKKSDGKTSKKAMTIEQKEKKVRAMALETVRLIEKISEMTNTHPDIVANEISSLIQRKGQVECILDCISDGDNYNEKSEGQNG